MSYVDKKNIFSEVDLIECIKNIMELSGLLDALKNDASEQIVWLRFQNRLTNQINYQSIIKHCGGEHSSDVDVLLPQDAHI